MVRVFRSAFAAIDGRPSARGGTYRLEMLPTTCHVYFGEVCGATPDGRRAGKPLSEGISPVQGADRRGPTAVFRSAGKMDHVKTGGTLLNMKLAPSLLAGEEGVSRLAQLVQDLLPLRRPPRPVQRRLPRDARGREGRPRGAPRPHRPRRRLQRLLLRPLRRAEGRDHREDRAAGTEAIAGLRRTTNALAPVTDARRGRPGARHGRDGFPRGAPGGRARLARVPGEGAQPPDLRARRPRAARRRGRPRGPRRPPVARPRPRAASPLVFHAAGRVSDWGPREAFLRANAEGTRNVVAACQEAGVSRLVHLSSLTVLGLPRDGRVISESTPTAPPAAGDFYTESKLDGERMRPGGAREERPLDDGREARSDLGAGRSERRPADRAAPAPRRDAVRRRRPEPPRALVRRQPRPRARPGGGGRGGGGAALPRDGRRGDHRARGDRRDRRRPRRREAPRRRCPAGRFSAPLRWSKVRRASSG